MYTFFTKKKYRATYAKGFTHTPKFGVSLQSKRGFTLVETLVAISILSLSIAATFTAVQNGLQSSTIAKDQTTAFFLAQEGMELIRNRRDENALASIGSTPRNWLNGMAEAGDPCAPGRTCRIDASTATFVDCGGGLDSCPVIGQNATTGRYGYAYPATTFKREMQFEIIGTDEVSVLIHISWMSRGVTRSFQIHELLFNHQ